MTLVQHKLPISSDPARLREDLARLESAERQAQPGPYHNGEWTGISLRSAGGRTSAAPGFASLEDYAFTTTVDRTPYFKEILSGLPFPVQVARILSLPPNGTIGEHFDFFANFQFGVLRLHIPIVTHPDVDFIIDGERCVWAPGELWYGDFSKVHSVHNRSDVTRVHLVMDCEIDDRLLAMFPPDYVAHQAKAGITVLPSSPPEPAVDLSRYACDLRIPGTVMPILVLGNLKDLVGGCSARVSVDGSRLTVRLDGGQEFALRPLDGHRFRIVGLAAGCFLEFDPGQDGVRGATFVIRGVQRDLVRARLGVATGDPLAEQRIPLELLRP